MDLSQFQTYLTESGRAERTTFGYLKDMELFSRWFEQTNGELLSPQNLTPTDVREYRQYLIYVKKAKPSTINRHLSAIRAFSNWAKNSGETSYSFAENIKSVAQQSQAPKWLDKKEQAALIREVEKRVLTAETEPARRQAARDQAILVILLNTGLRVSELVGLELTDVTVLDRKGEIRVRAGKGMKERVVPLNDTARKAIRAWLAVRPENSSKNLFISQRGPASTRAVQSILEGIGKDARIDHLTPHMARHTFAKNLVNSGVSLEKVAMLLGHSSLDTTMIYTTPGIRDLEHAVQTLDA
jgi:site-specific recombinase XerD